MDHLASPPRTIMSVPEDKGLTVLRRKLIVGIPIFGITGYMVGRMIAEKYNFSRIVSRMSRIGGAIITPIIGTMMIVHFNRAEIFRIGSGMMKELEETRKAEIGPFADPLVREKWDTSYGGNRQFGHKIFKTSDELIEKDAELRPQMDYQALVSELTSRDKATTRFR